MPLCSSPPSDGGPDPICLSSMGQSATPQAPWFWRVLEWHLWARSVGDNQGSRPHGSPVPADGIRPRANASCCLGGPLQGCRPPLLLDSLGGLQGVPTAAGSWPASPAPQHHLYHPPFHGDTTTGFCGHLQCGTPQPAPWSRGNIFTKNQTGCCSLGIH